MWAPFQHRFRSMPHTFFDPCFRTRFHRFELISGTLNLQKPLFYYVKTMIYRKLTKESHLNNSLIFQAVLVSFGDPVSHKLSTLFYINVLMPFRIVFFNVCEKLVPKLLPKQPLSLLRGHVLAFRNTPRTHPWHPLDFASIWGAIFEFLFVPIAVVFGTRVVELELAPASNHGSWFAGFSSVRRLRFASTLTFEDPFGIVFSCEWSIINKSVVFQYFFIVFSWLSKTAPGDYF